MEAGLGFSVKEKIIVPAARLARFFISARQAQVVTP